MAAEGVAVLLMAYGGPGSLDEVEPYLLDVRGGRPTPPELVAEIRSRYAQIGGRSPIRERTDAQARALGRALGAAWPVYVGMRHWHPFIKETVERIVADGHARVVAIVLAPHYSALSGLAHWRLAYQSAGATPEPWLGPEAGAVMTELAAQGQRHVLVVPIGFVSDHVEVLYDVDIAYRALADRLGIQLERTDSLNDDPLLVAALAQIARTTAGERGWV